MLLFDIDKSWVETIYHQEDSKPIAFSIRFTDHWSTPIITGQCNKGDDVYWKTFYWYLRKYFYDPQVDNTHNLYIKGFQQPVKYLTIRRIV